MDASPHTPDILQKQASKQSPRFFIIHKYLHSCRADDYSYSNLIFLDFIRNQFGDREGGNKHRLLPSELFKMTDLYDNTQINDARMTSAVE